jgi:creatinine amidohydrolase
MRLDLMTWPEVEFRLTHDKGIILPIGSMEQHGPNGLIGTDALCPTLIADVHAANDAVLIGPTFTVGIAQHHMAFTGTMTLRPSTFIAVMEDWVHSLARHGFSHFYFLNGHGGNIATIQAAFAQIYTPWSLRGHACPLRLKLMNWWELPGVAGLCDRLYPAGQGSHATPSEVAVTYAGFPHAVKSVTMSPKIAPEGRFADAADYRFHFPDGRIGSDPSQASVEDGRRIIEAAGTALLADARSFFAEAIAG